MNRRGSDFCSTLPLYFPILTSLNFAPRGVLPAMRLPAIIAIAIGQPSEYASLHMSCRVCLSSAFHHITSHR